MHETLIQYINSHLSSPLTESDTDIIRNIFKPRRIRKRQYFLQEGETCNNAGFIVKGSMRQYSIDEKGVEHIVALSIENWWVLDRESFTLRTPTIYNIDACEDTDMLTLSHNDMDAYFAISGMNELAQKLDQKHAFANQKRINASISFTAEQRYNELQKNYPQFFQRFPQHSIASYLGITKETLSRIRAANAKK